MRTATLRRCAICFAQRPIARAGSPRADRRAAARRRPVRAPAAAPSARSSTSSRPQAREQYRATAPRVPACCEHVAVGLGGDREAVRHADALGRQFAVHLAERRVLAADQRARRRCRSRRRSGCSGIRRACGPPPSGTGRLVGVQPAPGHGTVTDRDVERTPSLRQVPAWARGAQPVSCNLRCADRLALAGPSYTMAPSRTCGPNVDRVRGRAFAPPDLGESMKAKVWLIAALVVALCALVGGGWWWFRHRNAGATDAIVLHGNVDIRQVELAFNAAAASRRCWCARASGSQRASCSRCSTRERLRQARGAGGGAGRRAAPGASRAWSRVAAARRSRKARADVEAARVDARNAEQTYRRARRTGRAAFRPATAGRRRARRGRGGAGAAQERATRRCGWSSWARARRTSPPPRPRWRRTRPRSRSCERDLAATSLHAPPAGVIENRVLEAGRHGLAAEDRCYTLALTDPLWVRAYVPETDLGRIRPGSRAGQHRQLSRTSATAAGSATSRRRAEFTPKSVETREVRTTLVYQVRVFVCAPPSDGLRLGMPRHRRDRARSTRR